MNTSDKIYVAGHSGLVGSALVNELMAQGFNNLVTRNSSELDLLNQAAVFQFLASEKPDFVFIAAAKVGGIVANDTFKADFIYQNLQIQNNLIHGSYLSEVKKLLFLGSSCIYPKNAPLPIKEDALLTGVLEPTNDAYAIAKIAGIKMCENYKKQYGCNFISAMPTNLYGTNDNFDLNNSHFIPALIRNFQEAKGNGAKEVIVWGSGKPKREFMHAADLAKALVLVMQVYNENTPINVGSGKELSIADLALLISDIVGYKGKIKYDLSKPDGVMSKLLDNSKLSQLGWQSSIALKDGLKAVCDSFLKEQIT